MITLDKAIDLLVLHRINFERYSDGVVRRMAAQLNKADADIFARMLLLLEDMPRDRTEQAAYLDSLLKSVQTLNSQAYAGLAGQMQRDIRQASESEAAWNNRLYGSMASGEPLALVTAEQVYAAALSRPFQGVLLREVFPELGEARMRRMRDAIRTGFTTGKTGPQIVRELRGTKAGGFVDGFVEIDRRHLATVVNTALSHTAAVARERWEQENEDVVGSVMWLATLDGRTSAPCRLRDHKRYTKDTHKPIGHELPWGSGPGQYHYNCRSVSLALLPGQERLFGSRASKGGPVDANMDYAQWLKRQSAEVQDEVLGPVRGKLYRQGGLTLEKFSTDRGEWLTIDQLRERDAKAFDRAGM